MEKGFCDKLITTSVVFPSSLSSVISDSRSTLCIEICPSLRKVELFLDLLICHVYILRFFILLTNRIENKIIPTEHGNNGRITINKTNMIYTYNLICF